MDIPRLDGPYQWRRSKVRGTLYNGKGATLKAIESPAMEIVSQVDLETKRLLDIFSSKLKYNGTLKGNKSVRIVALARLFIVSEI